MKNLLFAVAFCFNFSTSIANQDSLQSVWNNHLNKEEIRLNALHQMIRNVMFSNPDSALQLAKIEYEFALAIKNKIWEAKALNTMGVASNFQGDINGAIEFYKQSLEIQKIVKDSTGIANTLNNLGIILDEQGDLAQSIDFYKQSLSIRILLGDKRGIADCHNNIGIVQQEMGHQKEALSHYLQALQIRQELNDEYAIAASYSNIGIVYKKQGRYKKALDTYQNSLAIHLQFNDLQGAAGLYYNIGNIWELLNNPDSAFNNYDKSISIKRELGDLKSLPVTLNSAAQLHYELLEFEKALELATESYEIAQRTGNVTDLSNATSLLSNLNNEKGNVATAFEFYKIHIKLRDSLKNEENYKAAVHLKLQNEFEKKQLLELQQKREAQREEAERIDRRNTIQYSGIGLGIFFLFGLVFLFGRIRLPNWAIKMSVFLPFLILFEFLLVITDPFVDNWSEGEPLIKLGLNVLMAGAIFPLHSFFENFLKNRLFNSKL